MNISKLDIFFLIVVCFLRKVESLEYSISMAVAQGILKFCQQNGETFVTLTTTYREDNNISISANNTAIK